MFAVRHTVVLPRAGSLVALLALAALGCGFPGFRAAHLTQPVSMSPMADASLSVEAGRLFVTSDILEIGVDEGTALAVELGITNGGREPYSLSAASLSCWLELSPDLPGETLSLTPAGGGEGAFPEDTALGDLKLGSTTIPAGETRRYWVVFRGYRYPGSDVPRKVTISLPDARGRRVQVVIADPARGQLRWEAEAPGRGWAYGVHNTTLFASGMSLMAVGGNLAFLNRAGPLLWDFGLTTRLVVQTQGDLDSPTSSFTGVGLSAHVTWPFVAIGSWQDPYRFGIYAGGDLQLLVAIMPPPPPGEPIPDPIVYGAGAVEAGVEFDIGAVRRSSTPFPVSLTGRSLPRWTVRFGYTHWFAGGLNSGGYTTALRLAW